MAMGWGGVIASALAGGAAGAMSSVAKDIDDQQKAALQAQRDERLAQLAQQTHKVNAQASADIELAQAPLKAKVANDLANTYAPDANARAAAATRSQIEPEAEKAAAIEKAKEGEKYHTLSPGVRLVKGDKVVIEGEPRVLTEEEAEYWNARTENERAKAGLWVAKTEKTEAGGGGKDDKPRNVKAFEWKEEEKRGPGGVKKYVDKTTGFTKEVIPAVAAKEAKSGILGWGAEAAVPGKEEQVIYKDPEGKVVPFEVVEAKRYEVSGVKPGGSTGGSSAPPLPKEGTVLRKDGVLYVVRGGQIVKK